MIDQGRAGLSDSLDGADPAPVGSPLPAGPMLLEASGHAIGGRYHGSSFSDDHCQNHPASGARILVNPRGQPAVSHNPSSLVEADLNCGGLSSPNQLGSVSVATPIALQESHDLKDKVKIQPSGPSPLLLCSFQRYMVQRGTYYSTAADGKWAFPWAPPPVLPSEHTAYTEKY